MQVEQRVRKLRGRQPVPLAAPPRTDEVRPHRRIEPDDGPRDREPGIQVSAGAATGEEDVHRAATMSDPVGSVAPSPITRSRTLPMFTSMPVISMESTRFDRPKEMNGSVRPVVGSSPMTTPMCRYAVMIIVVVIPIATSDWNGVRACFAILNPSQPHRA